MALLIQQLIDRGQNISISDLGQPANAPLTVEIQTQLCVLGLLDPIIDGNETMPFWPVRLADGQLTLDTRNAIIAFHRHANLPYVDNLLTPEVLQALNTATPARFLPIQLDNQPADDQATRLAKRILRYMHFKGYWIARAPNMYNIVYVEGIDPDGRPNKDRFNEWNDRRMVIRIAPGGRPEMIVNDQATTEPGRFYTLNPLNRLGAARIAFGQYKAWVDGVHKGNQPALVQVGPVRLHRDRNKDGFRGTADPIDIGSVFGINQHSTGRDITPAFVDKFSAGCLVGRRYRWHLSFMHIIRQDFRYVMNKAYVFMTTVVNGDELMREEPV
ncbi:MAG: peptidoglycan-binding protein [Thermoanaerobaculia bacterium]|nr:peptidoglycan-binding protein [Thermoanaerobaculia bacterium]